MHANQFERLQSQWAQARMARVTRCFIAGAITSIAIGFSVSSFGDTVAAVELTGTPSSTGLTGFPGSKFTLGDADSASRALVGVLSRERSDDPCNVSVGWEDVNNSGTNGALTKDLCGSNGPSSATMGGTYANTGGDANRVFVSGAQVCMNKSDDRIKGIHLHGKRITDTGTLVDFGPDQQDSRTNCHQDHWKRWVNCPTGQIATAAIVHFEAGNTPRSWVGIELQCRGIRVTGTTSASTNPAVLPHGEVGVIGCSDTESLDVRATSWNIAEDWPNFSSELEKATGFNVGSCLQDRFGQNGKVECVHKYDCKDNKCKLGFGGGLGTTVKLFQTFFDNISALPQADRRACYAAMMTHEFSHTCEHYAEAGPESRARAAFNYWKNKFPVSSGLTINSNSNGCGMND